MRQKSRHLYDPAAVLGLCLLIATGCAGKSSESRHYILSPIENDSITATDSDNNQHLRIGVGPITFPTYLKRPQIVIRKNANQLKLLDFDRWAEPLENNVDTVIVGNLSLLLDSDFVYPYPWKNRQTIDFQITVTVYRFDATIGENVELIAAWAVLSGEDKSLLLKKTTRLRKALPSDSPAGIVKALNNLLSDFSHELADTVKSISESNNRQNQ